MFIIIDRDDSISFTHVDKHYRQENDDSQKIEERINNAEQRAMIAEEHMFKMQEELKVSIDTCREQITIEYSRCLLLILLAKSIGSLSIGTTSSRRNSTFHQGKDSVMLV
jgi:hypothetical protein